MSRLLCKPTTGDFAPGESALHSESNASLSKLVGHGGQALGVPSSPLVPCRAAPGAAARTGRPGRGRRRGGAGEPGGAGSALGRDVGVGSSGREAARVGPSREDVLHGAAAAVSAQERLRAGPGRRASRCARRRPRAARALGRPQDVGDRGSRRRTAHHEEALGPGGPAQRLQQSGPDPHQSGR